MVVARASSTYRPRDAEHSVLHTVIREHLDLFLREVSDRGDGGGLPRFVEQEFRELLTCGVLAHGFARVRCAGGGATVFSTRARMSTSC